MAKLTVKDLNVRGKRVFLRVDYNVPLEEKDGQMVITDATRIVETLPTLRLLVGQGGKLILAAHLGRPKGKRESSMSLRPVAGRLAELLGRPVAFVDDCIGEKVEKTVSVMQPGDVILLENVRYYSEEEANDATFDLDHPPLGVAFHDLRNAEVAPGGTSSGSAQLPEYGTTGISSPRSSYQ